MGWFRFETGDYLYYKAGGIWRKYKVITCTKKQVRVSLVHDKDGFETYGITEFYPESQFDDFCIDELEMVEREIEDLDTELESLELQIEGARKVKSQYLKKWTALKKKERPNDPTSGAV